MADPTAAARPPTRDEIRILRHYADGQQLKHIVAMAQARRWPIGQTTEEVRAVIDEWTGFTHQRAKDIVRRWWLLVEQQPEVNPSAEPPPAHHKSPPPTEPTPDGGPADQPSAARITVAATPQRADTEPVDEQLAVQAFAGDLDARAAIADGSTSADLVSVSGMSYRQLDHWTRKGYLQCANPGAGSGVARVWPDAELRVAETMSRLRDVGLSVETAHLVARAGGRVELAPGIWVAVDTPAEVIPPALDEVLLRAVKAGGEHGRRAGQLREQILALGAELEDLDRIAAQQKRVEELRRQLDAEEAKLRDLTSGAPKQEEAAA